MFLREKLFLQLIAYSEDKKQKFQIIKNALIIINILNWKKLP